MGETWSVYENGTHHVWTWRGEPVTREEYERREAFARHRDEVFQDNRG